MKNVGVELAPGSRAKSSSLLEDLICVLVDLLRGHEANLESFDHSISIDEDTRWYAGDLIQPLDGSIFVQQDRKGNSEFVHERLNIRHRICIGQVDAKDHEALILMGLIRPDQLGHFLPAGQAPACPEVEQHRLAAELR